jgi:hypothetical protein
LQALAGNGQFGPNGPQVTPRHGRKDDHPRCAQGGEDTEDEG